MRRDHKDEDVGHSHNSSVASSSSILRWQTAKHALRCLIGCNIGEGTGAAIGFTLGNEASIIMSIFIMLFSPPAPQTSFLYQEKTAGRHIQSNVDRESLCLCEWSDVLLLVLIQKSI